MNLNKDILGNNNQNIYNLTPNTLFEVAETILPRCLCVMPLEPKRKLQRFVLGTQRQIEMWECKKGEMVNVLKTDSELMLNTKQISRVVLTATSETNTKIFYSIGQQLKGLSKKGTEFLSLDTSHAE